MTAQLVGRWAIRSVRYRLFVTTGIVSGFTTFSAFLTELTVLLQRWPVEGTFRWTRAYSGAGETTPQFPSELVCQSI
ncbi:hypothetical protein MES4922_240004 [Mesorhizobium ventifaucium]|uniref:Uncharacterized protein n=1 Tax=Mesorhizobium ventifaucium TaxID=666020 RepID=A0ABM9DUR7_9HYPH|nr:hypothetical protein MES4922_240004 [Mesorhizobium ventifaucium]